MEKEAVSHEHVTENELDEEMGSWRWPCRCTRPQFEGDAFQVRQRSPQRGSRELRSWFGEFQPVAPGIVRIESLDDIQRLVPCAADSCLRKFLKQVIDVVDREGWMRLSSRVKIPVNADVELLIPYLEPATSARTKRFRFFDLFETEQAAEEIARLGFATGWRGNLNVIDSDQQGFHYDADSRV